MTVKEAIAKLLKRFGLKGLPCANNWLADVQFDQFIEVKHWLHRLASANMEKSLGDNWGSSSDLPPDIDEATVLTSYEEEEFFKRLGECHPRPVPYQGLRKGTGTASETLDER